MHFREYKAEQKSICCYFKKALNSSSYSIFHLKYRKTNDTREFYEGCASKAFFLSCSITYSIQVIYFTEHNSGNVSVLKAFIKSFPTLLHTQAYLVPQVFLGTPLRQGEKTKIELTCFKNCQHLSIAWGFPVTY